MMSEVSHTVLIVEDLDSDYELLERRFRGVSAELLRTRTIADTERLLARMDAPEFVVLDLRLPDGDGRELLPRLREIPAAVWTAFDDPEVEASCLRNGIRCVVRKAADRVMCGREVDRIIACWRESRTKTP